VRFTGVVQCLLCSFYPPPLFLFVCVNVYPNTVPLTGPSNRESATVTVVPVSGGRRAIVKLLFKIITRHPVGIPLTFQLNGKTSPPEPTETGRRGRTHGSTGTTSCPCEEKIKDTVVTVTYHTCDYTQNVCFQRL